jgi:hypothetical protein
LGWSANTVVADASSRRPAIALARIPIRYPLVAPVPLRRRSITAYPAKKA